jgi:hypothetical protein
MRWYRTESRLLVIRAAIFGEAGRLTPRLLPTTPITSVVPLLISSEPNQYGGITNAAGIPA